MLAKQLKHAFKWVFFWMGMAMLFGVGVWVLLGPNKALEYLGSYLIELSLSVDNLFVFLTLFLAYGVTRDAQHKALNYGIAGAIVLRFLFIFFGAQLVSRFEWLLYIFGVILIINGVLMFRKDDDEEKPKENKLMKFISSKLRMTPDFVGTKLFSRENGKLFFTPLFAVIILIEFSDILFAMDSVPAIFSITTDVLIVYSSNIFAILGLRQLYFVLLHLHSRFAYVKYGVGVLLLFTGVKLVVGIFNWHISNFFSIAFILVVMVLSVLISMFISRGKK